MLAVGSLLPWMMSLLLVVRSIPGSIRPITLASLLLLLMADVVGDVGAVHTEDGRDEVRRRRTSPALSKALLRFILESCCLGAGVFVVE